MNIVLTGFMASGKSETAKQISQISGRKLIDTDEFIIEREGRSINEIFASDGEKYFRKVEAEAVNIASEYDNCVIATGGGVVLNKENIKNLRKNGVIFNLAPSFDVIEKRLKKASATRPLLQNQEIGAIRKRFEDRLDFYADCDFKINVTNEKSPAEYAKEILGIFARWI